MEDTKRTINNSVVVPEYRKFCKDNNLPFNLWDELPEEAFNVDLARKEMKIYHKEAMDIFNLAKSPYSYLDKNIIQWHFTDWSGDFEYESEPVEEFLAKQEDELKILGKKHYAMAVIGTLSFSLLILILLNYYRISLYITFPAFIASLFLENYVGYFIKHRKNNSAKDIGARLNKLRKNLNEINQ